MGQGQKSQSSSQSSFNLIGNVSSLHDVITFKLTFASVQALKPPMINVSVAGSSAVLVPSTAGSAATDSAGFLELATRWARDHISNFRRGDRWRGD